MLLWNATLMWESRLNWPVAFGLRSVQERRAPFATLRLACWNVEGFVRKKSRRVESFEWCLFGSLIILNSLSGANTYLVPFLFAGAQRRGHVFCTFLESFPT
jgi:hypothetical protein